MRPAADVFSNYLKVFPTTIPLFASKLGKSDVAQIFMGSAVKVFLYVQRLSLLSFLMLS